MSVLGLALAAPFVALMGFAIQRGGTCTVAAVDELLTQRRARRLLAMGEASLWVAGSLALATVLGLTAMAPAGLAIDRCTVLGAVTLGLGAWLNRACVFGAIARLGSGEWAYALTPFGFFVGCLLVMPWRRPAAPPIPLTHWVQAAPWLALAFLAFAAWRLAAALRHGRPGLRQRVWEPHAATIVIGISFVAVWLLAGRWAYTDLLADLAAGMAMAQASRSGLLLALLGGALWGGWTAGRWRPLRPGATALLRCFTGGLLMGIGSLLIPGSNDGLILVGLPLLQPHAWLAFGLMLASIALALSAAERVRPARPATAGP